MIPEKLKAYRARFDLIQKMEKDLADCRLQIFKEMQDDGIFCSRCVKLVKIEDGVPTFVILEFLIQMFSPKCFVEKEKEN